MTTIKSAVKTSSTAAKKTATRSPARKATPAKVAAPRKVAAPKAASAVKPAPKVVASKIKAPKKPKLVRDSFTMPKDEYQAIDSLKQRATRLQRSVKKSELLRAGIMALTALDDKNFAAILAKVPALKTGRPGRA